MKKLVSKILVFFGMLALAIPGSIKPSSERLVKAGGEPVVIKTAPTEITGLKYNGGPQNLINEGSADETGHMEYNLDGGAFSKSIPQATNAGNYTVGYKAVPDPEWAYMCDSSAVSTINVSIGKRDAKIKTGTASKAYDGTAITCSDYEVIGFVAGEEPTSVTTFGSQTYVGSNTNEVGTVTTPPSFNASNYNITYDKGALIVTPNPNTINIIVKSNTKTYDGTPLTSSASDYETNAADVLKAGDVLTCSVDTLSITDAGSVDVNLHDYSISHGGDDVTSCYTINVIPGTLTINPRPITVTTGSDTKAYNGTPLTNNIAVITSGSLIQGHQMFFNVTGSQTDVGSSKNEFTYEFNPATAAANYNVTKQEGTLTVEKVAGTISASINSISKEYDGTALEATYTVTNEDKLLNGHRVDITLDNTSRTDAGETIVKCTSFKILDSQDNDVSSCYNLGSVTDGKITITKRAITIETESDSKIYDGSELTNENYEITSGSFVNGQDIDGRCTGKILSAGTAKNTFSYEAKAGTNLDNYDITVNEGELTVTKIEDTLKISVNDVQRAYDTTELSSDYSYTDGILLDGDVLFVELENNSRKAIGHQEVTVKSYKIMRGDVDVTSAYNIEIESGSISVTFNYAALGIAVGVVAVTGTVVVGVLGALECISFIVGSSDIVDIAYNVIYSAVSLIL